MKVGTKIILLLTIFTVSCKSDCYNNTYPNNKSLLPFINNYLYTYVTSTYYGNNEIFKFDFPINKNIYCRTTNDAYGGCCITLNLSTEVDAAGFFEYTIHTDADCPQQFNQNAHLKLLAVNPDKNGYCIIVWTCRTSREGVHTFCTKSQQTKEQQKWIAAQYASLNLTEVAVAQNTELKY